MADVLLPLRPDEEKMFQGQPKGFPLGDFDINDVMLPADNDFGVESDEDEIADDEIVTESGFGSVIVVDNVPKVGPEKLDKLLGVLTKLFSQLGTVRDGGISMPKDEETNTTLGFAFIEYSSPAEAQAAMAQINGYKLDKHHTFAVSKFDDFDRYARVTEEYTPAEPKDYEPRENLHEWCVDRRGRDQFVARYMDETEIFFNDAQRNYPESVYRRALWTDGFVQWSPKGTYMTTVHTKGVAIWGGASFKRLQRFGHNQVQAVQWSPGENYIVTFSRVEPQNPTDTAKLILNVFEVKTGRRLRNFELSPDDLAIGVAPWPIFKWAGGGDDKYFARLGRGQISVYETPECNLLDKRSIKLENVQDFQWSPEAPVISAYQAEQSSGNLPARVVLLKIPEKKEMRQKNLFSVSDVAMFWHPQGEYLAVRVDKFTKTRKTTYTSLELFSTKERDIPMEVLDLPNKADKVVDFAWEPNGTRFAMLHGENNRPSFSLYEMKDMKTHAKGVQPVGTLTKKQANTIKWSPQGKYLVLAGFKGMGEFGAGMNGQLEFVAADDMEVLSAAEHFLASVIDWDPTGRYIATAVVNQPNDNGVTFWQFDGHELFRFPREKLFQFQWRPRPQSRLSEAQKEDILKNLKKYSRKYDEEDAQILNAADTEIIAERSRLMDEWKSWYESKQDWVEEIELGRKQILGEDLQEGEYTVQEVEAEVPIGMPVEEIIRQ